jgi:hypothetical protein
MFGKYLLFLGGVYTSFRFKLSYTLLVSLKLLKIIDLTMHLVSFLKKWDRLNLLQFNEHI